MNIPPGVTDGQRIRLAGQGGRARGDAARATSYLVVRIAPHPRYRVRGRDIYVDLPLTPWEAALGATIPVETPGGQGTRTRPAGLVDRPSATPARAGNAQPSGHAGDLHAEVKVMVPPTLSERERELFEELAKVSTFDPRRPRSMIAYPIDAADPAQPGRGSPDKPVCIPSSSSSLSRSDWSMPTGTRPGHSGSGRRRW